MIEPNFRDQCLAARVPFFFKQWGGFNKKKAERLLYGRTWDDMGKRASSDMELSLRSVLDVERGHFLERWGRGSGAFCSGLFQVIAMQRYGLNIMTN
ncbi:MAG: DUF5131 family protein [Desulfobacteraceae bacterium]|nr:DUF5131 family protein [Desulfobacteraceae bacterium]